MGRWQWKHICLLDSLTFFTVMPKLQEGKQFLWFLLHSIAWERVWTRHGLDSRADKNQLFYPGPQFLRCRMGELLISFYMEKAIMKTTEVDQNQGILVKHLLPASESLTDSTAALGILLPLATLKISCTFWARISLSVNSGVGMRDPWEAARVSHKNPLPQTTWIYLPLLKPPELRQ